MRILRGLQKTKYYCQVCERQCLDENGFKCHIASDSHLRRLRSRMDSVGNDEKRLVAEYSSRFLRDFLALLRKMHGEKLVGTNRFYQEYIQDKDHVHLNSTRWKSLGGLVKYLEASGKCRVEQGDDDEGTLIGYREGKDAKRPEGRQKRGHREDEESQRILEEQIARGKRRARRLTKQSAKQSDTQSDTQSATQSATQSGLGAKKAGQEQTAREAAAAPAHPGVHAPLDVSDAPSGLPDSAQLSAAKTPAKTPAPAGAPAEREGARKTPGKLALALAPEKSTAGGPAGGRIKLKLGGAKQPLQVRKGNVFRKG